MEDLEPVNHLFDKTLQLDLLEDENVISENLNRSTKFPIIAEVLCEKPLNNKAIKTTLSNVWKIPPKTPTNIIDQNTLLENVDDRSHLRHQSPWSFRGNLVS
ncbi:hypothetical protein Salat_2129600 [Sesamum alatum]|uniref:Uncharacterized protein n=1 Tax=Sesamum alatum TaxID=300844 RepID=A0AAE2CH21_9LAMI|nr:hypothetical protein Salat_2129600 [Sesamum alatum]